MIMPSTAKVTVVAKLTAKPGREDDVRRTLLALVPPTRAEAGCLNYDLHQSKDDPGIFVFYENWINRTALDEHLQKPYLQDLFARADDLLAEPVDVHLMDEISD
jgi:quinol monooxygenase YgiN